MANLELSEEERASSLAFLMAYKAFSNIGVFQDIYSVVKFIEENLSFPGNVFRGQRLDWPIKSSGWRFEEGERNLRYKKTLDFMTWLLNNPYLEAYHEPQIKLLAIAQHYSAEYGFVTDLIDFSRDYNVAAYFASHGDINDGDIGALYVTNISCMDMAYKHMKIEGISILDIKGLWRIENQKGIFLKDVNGDFAKFGLVLKLSFRQSPSARFETEVVNDKSMYPEPNSLEREINRYLSFERRSHLPEEVDKLFQVISVERDPISIEAESIVPSVPWEDEELEAWKRIYVTEFTKPPDLSDITCVVNLESDEAIVTRDEIGSLMALAQELEKAKSTPFIPRVSMNFQFRSPLINLEKSERMVNQYMRKYAATYFPLPFSIEEKCASMKTLMLFAYYNGSNLPTVISDELDTITQTFKTGHLTQCDFEDTQQIVSYGYVPNSFFDTCNRMTTARELFNDHFRGTKLFIAPNSGAMIDTFLKHNFQVLQFLYTAQKLFSFDDIRRIWAHFVIPYQIAFRSESAIVANPYYVTIIGLA